MKRVIISSKVVASGRVDDQKYLCRIARYREFDNGHVLHGGWKKMFPPDAEEAARQASIGHPDDVYYVAYDNIMDSSSDFRYVDGEAYHYSQIKFRGDSVEIID